MQVDEILALAGAPLMTMPVSFMQDLISRNGTVSNDLDYVYDGDIEPDWSQSQRRPPFNDIIYRTKGMYEEALKRERIALDKLPEGLKKFSEDVDKLEELVRTSLQAKRDWSS